MAFFDLVRGEYFAGTHDLAVHGQGRGSHDPHFHYVVNLGDFFDLHVHAAGCGAGVFFELFAFGTTGAEDLEFHLELSGWGSTR